VHEPHARNGDDPTVEEMPYLFVREPHLDVLSYTRPVRILSTNPNEPGVFAVGQEAVGIFALGQLALGVVAVGQLSRGVVAVGQLSVGVFCIGQGAVGLFHGTGMLAIAGQQGFGLALHLLPRLVAEPPPQLELPTPVASLLGGAASYGWIPMSIVATPGGVSAVADEAPGLAVDLRAVRAALEEGHASGCDRAHVRVRVDVTVDPSGYRAAQREVTLVAEQLVAHRTRPRRHLAYGVPPVGKSGGRAGTTEIALRTLGWLIALALVSLVTFAPLAEALLR
jgi:hypothetical protein